MGRRKLLLLISGSIVAVLFLSFVLKPNANTLINEDKINFPYKSQGLSDRQAAAHLLSRFTYGATPGQIDEVLKIGLEKWFQLQLEGKLNEDTLTQHLSKYEFLNLSNEEADKMFPKPAQVLKMAIEDGIIPKDSISLLGKDEVKSRIKSYVADKNIHNQRELVRQFVNQRILRARYSSNQLQEVLTGFWFNHFNVSLTKPQVILLAPAYERDVIRPNVTGKFGDLLLATAQSPAMLMYLDNASSSGDMESVSNTQNRERFQRFIERNQNSTDSATLLKVEKLKNARKNKGLNENFARELMELHTLGVDGGYTQSDVTQTARILTGWGLYPYDQRYAKGTKKLIESIGEEKLKQSGFVRNGDFLFAINRHDIKEKNVLGKTYPANGGYSEGVDLLNMLAHHTSTAKFISKKLAVYFVSDNPPQSLINKMTKTFLDSDGAIKAVLITMVTAPEFWSVGAVRQKTKSPFELVVSATRALDSDIDAPFQLFLKMDKMGQKIYYYQAPTGFPDNATYWVNAGALLNRMNFGLDIASGKIRGTYTDLLKLNQYHEPENATAALITYVSILLPEREMGPTIKRLSPLLTTPGLKEKLAIATQSSSPNQNSMIDSRKKMMDIEDEIVSDDSLDIDFNENKIKSALSTENMLAQIVGIIIGSPEFQRK
ncbi:MAG: DUF1800 domain-containing protein [Bacteroidota bacterium]